jgi:hypothetical protein
MIYTALRQPIRQEKKKKLVQIKHETTEKKIIRKLWLIEVEYKNF